MNTTFQDIINSSLINLQQGTSVGIIEIILSLVITLFCSAIIIFTYKNTYQGVLYQKGFATTLVMAGLVTTSVIMVISGNLVLSLGMVGALSIVRFRAAIKDPMDIMYIFWAITVGIANGVAYIKISLVATIIISIILFIMNNRIIVATDVYLLSLKHNESNNSNIAGIIETNFDKSKLKMQSIKNGNYDSIYEVRGKSDKAIKMLNQVNDIEFSLISYENNV